MNTSNIQLNDISAGNITSTVSNINSISDGHRMANGIWKYLTENLRHKGMKDALILQIILEMDALIESGELTESGLKEYLQNLKA